MAELGHLRLPGDDLDDLESEHLRTGTDASLERSGCEALRLTTERLLPPLVRNGLERDAGAHGRDDVDESTVVVLARRGVRSRDLREVAHQGAIALASHESGTLLEASRHGYDLANGLPVARLRQRLLASLDRIRVLRVPRFGEGDAALEATVGLVALDDVAFAHGAVATVAIEFALKRGGREVGDDGGVGADGGDVSRTDVDAERALRARVECCAEHRAQRRRPDEDQLNVPASLAVEVAVKDTDLRDREPHRFREPRVVLGEADARDDREVLTGSAGGIPDERVRREVDSQRARLLLGAARNLLGAGGSGQTRDGIAKGRESRTSRFDASSRGALARLDAHVLQDAIALFPDEHVLNGRTIDSERPERPLPSVEFADPDLVGFVDLPAEIGHRADRHLADQSVALTQFVPRSIAFFDRRERELPRRHGLGHRLRRFLRDGALGTSLALRFARLGNEAAEVGIAPKGALTFEEAIEEFVLDALRVPQPAERDAFVGRRPADRNLGDEAVLGHDVYDYRLAVPYGWHLQDAIAQDRFRARVHAADHERLGYGFL